jgi:hypothetical protein
MYTKPKTTLIRGGSGKTGRRVGVLLAGRGEQQVRPAEQAVRESGAAFTILEWRS